MLDARDVIGFNAIDNLPRRRGNPGRKKPPVYKQAAAAFDIETSNITFDGEKHAIMYVWQLSIGLENAVIIGRTWREFQRIIDLLNGICGDNEFIICFVHNLSFEFQFLKTVLPFNPESVFCLNDRKVLRAVSGHIEFRCSLMQSNEPLSSFTRDYLASHVKLSGDDFNYNKKRFPWSRLSDDELAYCVNDVVGLLEAMSNRIDAAGDDLNTLPLTSTGYVRRVVKRDMRSFYRPLLRAMQPDVDLYNALRYAFRGGDTHENRFYTGLLLEGVEGVDITSSYPYSELAYQYPMRPFTLSKEPWTFDEIERYKQIYNMAFLIHVRLTGIRLKDPSWGFPYIPIAKTIWHSDVVNDNGRILSGSCEMWVTDIDLEIIHKEYDYNLEIIEVYVSKYAPLPKQIRDIIFNLFVDKSQLKGVAGKELQYQLKKAMLNSVYGLTAQDPGKLNFIYDGHDITLNLEKTIEDILKANKKNPYLAYQWGVFCTSWSRRRLHTGLWHVVKSGATPIYVDTDSIKYIGRVDWDPVNAECVRHGYTAKTIKGDETILGTFVPDGSYKYFISYGAKKYAYVDNDDKLHITIAGVSKAKGASELEAAGGISALKTGFTFKDAAGAEARYNDLPKMQIITYRGHEVELTSNVALTASTYTLGITSDYEQICYDGRFVSSLKKSIDLLFNMHYH